MFVATRQSEKQIKGTVSRGGVPKRWYYLLPFLLSQLLTLSKRPRTPPPPQDIHHKANDAPSINQQRGFEGMEQWTFGVLLV